MLQFIKQSHSFRWFLALVFVSFLAVACNNEGAATEPAADSTATTRPEEGGTKMTDAPPVDSSATTRPEEGGTQ
jgi:hypothetical protein